MDKKEMLAFINKCGHCFMATLDGNKPRVRPIGTFRADENGLVYSTQADKDIYKQLAKNPEVELCFFDEGTTVRICGRMEQNNDLALRKQVFEKRPFLKPGIDKMGWDYVGVFILKHGRASIIDAKAPRGAPKEYMDF
jgi:pyridoxamine 5'-phosphate oxidase